MGRFKIVFALVTILFLVGCVDVLSPNPSPIPSVCTETRCFSVAIVDTPELREQGLMFRTHLGADKGMLFIFPLEERYTFWMKNTLIPLDMIWISRDGIIMDIQTAIPCERYPCTVYTPRGKALYVLEVNAGAAEEAGMRIGDTLILSGVPLTSG
ncbi:MAG: DUF192 domain-containing protein [Candidatus Diapherotrites archaeon]|nr:DUF192 domain-containing protein [Candidatus Diapherotrites archaeon]MDZ4256326.1 DUF192 domain-containing protein [archaeon]